MEIITVECPFCRHHIKAFHKPFRVRELKKGSWGGCKKSYAREEEIFESTEGCPKCGKSKVEVDKALKHGKEPSREDVLKRLKEAGLDPSKLK